MKRQKEVTLDNVTVTIGSFTVSQAETLAAGKSSLFEELCLSLNNVRKEGEPEWTKDRLKDEFDWPTLNFLRKEILELSGMELKVTPGETKATEASPTSAAA